MAPWCRFHVATYVGRYIVSTVGECVPDAPTREIDATSRGLVLRGIGEERRTDWLEQCGYYKLGPNRIYETMVFTAKKQDGCCPWRVSSLRELDMRDYNNATDAYRGHLALCAKWGAKPKRKGG